MLSDSAGGVAPKNLPRLFQKGFSTKSQATNSEFGLHWCANALAALGGAISVHSDGIGRGTRFEIRLPLREADLQAADTAA